MLQTWSLNPTWKGTADAMLYVLTQNFQTWSASIRLEWTVRMLTEQKKLRPFRHWPTSDPSRLSPVENFKFLFRLSSPLPTLLSALLRRYCPLLHQSSALSAGLMLHVPFFFNANLQYIKNDVSELVIFIIKILNKSYFSIIKSLMTEEQILTKSAGRWSL